MLELLQKNMNRHNELLSEYACKDDEALRFQDEQEDFRTPFFHDIDRILYSYSYMRYADKTQVFPMQESDHITKRMYHVQMVSKIARTIGRALGLNEDLIEAASLGHDLGHVPFGHFGESILNELSLEHNEGYFHHNIESVRLLMNLERSGKGLNLTLQVLDAIMCHNGEFVLGEYHPVMKTKEDFLKEYEESYQNPDCVKQLRPMTLEGCVVRLSDMIAYLGRDIDDACSLGVFKKESIPESITNVLGSHNKTIVNKIVQDVITNSFGKPYLCLSDEVYEAMKSLKDFNYQHIYSTSLSEEKQNFIRKAFYAVYESCLNDLKEQNKDAEIYQVFLNYKVSDYVLHTSLERIALDFIAGMTDDYLLHIYNGIKKE